MNGTLGANAQSNDCRNVPTALSMVLRWAQLRRMYERKE